MVIYSFIGWNDIWRNWTIDYFCEMVILISFHAPKLDKYNIKWNDYSYLFPLHPTTWDPNLSLIEPRFVDTNLYIINLSTACRVVYRSIKIFHFSYSLYVLMCLQTHGQIIFPAASSAHNHPSTDPLRI